MSVIRKFPYLPVKIPRKHILARLGYNSRFSETAADILERTDRLIEHTADLIELKAAALRLDSESAGIFGSLKLERFLDGSGELILMGITGGRAVVEEIERLKADGNLTDAVVVDAAAGEIVDEGFDSIAAVFSRELLREGRTLTKRRFSAGYGDFDIRHQQEIYRLLELDKLDIDITESCMLLPEKSVTAIYGILGNNDERS